MGEKTVVTVVNEEGLEHFSGGLLVFPVEENQALLPGEAGALMNAILRKVWATGDFKGKKEQVFLLYPGLMDGGKALARIGATRILLAGYGKQEKDVSARREQLRLLGGVIAKQAILCRTREVMVALPDHFPLGPDEITSCLTEGFLLGHYRFDLYKKNTGEEDEAPGRVERFLVHGGTLPKAALADGLRAGRLLAEAASVARDMANQPANIWTPSSFAEYAKALEAETSLRCRVLDQEALREAGMGGILAVGQGSVHPPRLVILEYGSTPEAPVLLLIGKGLTFDSGGFCLKPGTGMENMKYDMCGGAAVLAVMRAIAEAGPEGMNVIGIIPAAENLPGGASFRPGDVIRHYGGKTSEIVNTDAEGRLLLADALAYGIAAYKPEAVIDLATLTGAAIVSLGHHYTALMSNNEGLAQQLMEAGALAGEPQWRLPLGPEYRKQLDSRIADLKNAGERNGGAIIAACYLQEFVGDTPWAHLDIAGTAWDFTEKSYIPKGPSGTGARTLLTLLRRWQPLKKTNTRDASRSAKRHGDRNQGR